MFNVRNRLIKLAKKRNTIEFAPCIKLLGKSIGDYFANDKANRVRSAAVGVKANLWKAVNAAKNINCISIPKNLTLGGLPIGGANVAESFAKNIRDKIDNNVTYIYSFCVL